MNKTLLIHTQFPGSNPNKILSFNTPNLHELTDNSIIFNFDNTDIDKYINTIIKKINNIEFNIIYIKDSLSENYIDFCGLRLAYHIRLSKELEDKRFVPIIILSDLDGLTLNKITPNANILLTKNMFISPNNATTIQHFNSMDLNKLIESEYKNNFLKNITVAAPTESHHDISNEWSIYIWSKFLDISSERIDQNKLKLSSMLYVKYLISKYTTEEIYQEELESKKSITQALVSKLIIKKKVALEEQRILYIDDEWDRGWKDIFNKIVNNFSKAANSDMKRKIVLKTVEEINKDTNYNELEILVSNYISSYDPNLIILDMRLIAEDHQNIKAKNISGLKLLKFIQEKINPGIQIIILTASGKSMLLNEVNKYNTLGYIKKEHPEDQNITIKHTFDKLNNLINTGFKNQYLKEIYVMQKNTLILDIFNGSKKNEKYYDIRKTLISIFEISNSNMENKFEYATLNIFKIFEMIVQFYIEEKKDYGKRFAYWLDTNNKVAVVNRESNIIDKSTSDYNDTTENKIRIVLHQKLKITDRTTHDKINKITKIRNQLIHPATNKVLIDENHILDWYKIIYIILEKENLLNA